MPTNKFPARREEGCSSASLISRESGFNSRCGYCIMARLSRDNSSWRAYGLSKRYEDWEADAKPLGPPKKKKDKKKWCKGKVGVEHDFQPYEREFGSRTIWRINKCTRCHKEVWKGATWYTK